MQTSQFSAKAGDIFWRLAIIKRTFPIAQRYLFVGSGILFFMGIKTRWDAVEAQKHIDYRKSQLEKPIYELKDSELTQPPWNKNNIQEWLYRPVRISGKPIHGQGIYIPRREKGQNGYEYVVPFVTSENKNGGDRKGYMVSLGFIPARWKLIPDRERLEDASVQTFDCFVSQLVELQDSNKFFAGNNIIKRDPKWNYVDLQKMAEFTQLQNPELVKHVVLERVELNSPNDERNTQHYNLDANHQQDYPYIKNKSGALQYKNQMPWDYRNTQKKWFSSSFLFGSLGLILTLIK